VPATIRFLFVGVAAVYLVCIAAWFVGPYPALIHSNLWGVGVLVFLIVTVALHAAIIAFMRNRDAVIISVGSLALVAWLILVGLMKITGDSL